MTQTTLLSTLCVLSLLLSFLFAQPACVVPPNVLPPPNCVGCPPSSNWIAAACSGGPLTCGVWSPPFDMRALICPPSMCSSCPSNEKEVISLLLIPRGPFAGQVLYYFDAEDPVPAPTKAA
jgi:hypothetical protein